MASMQIVFETFLERLSEGVDETDFERAMASAAAAFDLVSFAYIALPSRACDRPKLISNYPRRWTSRYLSSRYQYVDPVILRAQSGGGPFRWGVKFGEPGASRSQQQLLDEASEFGICCGVTIPIVDRHGRLAAMTFAADEADPGFLRVAERYGQALQLMAMCFHTSVRRKLSGDRTVDGVKLTPREYECLQWAARGKSAWEIGGILGIRKRTASFHLDNARRKLGVRTISQAVVLLASSRSSTL